VTDSTGAEVIVTSAERIVPVNGDLAEVVFALGSGPLDDLPARGESVPGFGREVAE
jgi:ABC-type hemin transport system substrate-binding protein